MRRNDNGITFGSYCNVLKASALEVPFELNTGLKQTIMARKITRQVTCAELKTIDPLTNREAFSLDVQVTFGLDEMEEVETVYGLTKVKRDIVVQDMTGTFAMQVFESKMKLFQDGEAYHIENCLLKKIKGDIFIGLHAETSVTAIPRIQGLPEVTGLSRPSTVVVEAFDSIKDIKVYYQCPSCKKPIDVVDTQARWIVCLNPRCNAQNRVSKLRLFGSCDVKFDVKDKEHWAHIFHDVMEKVVGKVVSESQIDSHLKSMENFKIVLFKDVIRDIISKDEHEDTKKGEDEK